MVELAEFAGTAEEAAVEPVEKSIEVVFATAVLDDVARALELTTEDDVELAHTDEDSCSIAVETPAEGVTVMTELETLDELVIERVEDVLEIGTIKELDEELTTITTDEEPGMTPLE
jgi:hypothetical protein